ncbi:2-oxo acid dehydrogenase subunit E2 [Evansella sp. LMS18]|uniref:dihydrolipoamide acetyltransferase family protein n=1 Tax=Evansella sp. LMS18 TaxID=2924033 RepID=UPI0020D01078|nr:dihydrolipoamide acetyltransferase family protein [Evansella sp. LMS18]UTR09070.1 2-oxo acid dehydrogenase subunit E2 [Evansella sp. LMS18]
MVEFKLPDVGEGMHEGEILSWFIKEGDFVEQDQPVLEVQTDKVNAELTAPASGVIKKIFFNEGEVAEVGSILFTIVEEGASEESAAAAEAVAEMAPQQTEEKKPAVTAVVSEGAGSAAQTRALATPFVRQMAREMKIDIEKVTGTGPAGRVTESDLRDYSSETVKAAEKAEPVEQSPGKETQKTSETNKVMEFSLGQEEERIPLKGIREKIAERMVKSVSTIPHVTHVDEMEMGPLKELRDELKVFAEQKNIKLTYLPFFIKAVVIALKEYKVFNASVDEENKEIVLKNYYHIGIATDTAQGLVVPVIKNADRKSILEIAREIGELAEQAREGKLKVNDITGSTFTISNVGPIGGMHATPIINHPEAAILALHKMEPRMVVRDWEGVISLMMNISLSFDHRIIDGVASVKFTNRIIELLENPKLLFMEMN